ncbi:MAG TPA: hypothetical protein VLF39_04610 [Candidatus Saccharimonadales bacterium]|nr:hypothetical protein [Candidatus Saccharimonadales bacterium]
MLNSYNVKKIVYGSFVVFVLISIFSAYFLPIDKTVLTKYSLSVFQYRLLVTSLLLPLIGIWTCAAYGFVHYKQYALSIRGSTQGKGTNTIANGLGIIALQLIVSGGFNTITSINSVKQAVGGDRGVQIISTGTAMLFSLVAGLLLYQGASQLNSSLAKHSKPKLFSKSLYVLLATSVVFLIGIILSYPSYKPTNSVYKYVPLSVAIVGIWAPSLFVWTFYLLAVKYLHHYQHNVKGKVNRKALGLLARGVYFILGSSVLIQLIGTLNGVLANASLTPILVIVYPLIVAIGLGYLFIAEAATKLRQVES